MFNHRTVWHTLSNHRTVAHTLFNHWTAGHTLSDHWTVGHTLSNHGTVEYTLSNHGTVGHPLSNHWTVWCILSYTVIHRRTKKCPIIGPLYTLFNHQTLEKNIAGQPLIQSILTDLAVVEPTTRDNYLVRIFKKNLKCSIPVCHRKQFTTAN